MRFGLHLFSFPLDQFVPYFLFSFLYSLCSSWTLGRFLRLKGEFPLSLNIISVSMGTAFRFNESVVDLPPCSYRRFNVLGTKTKALNMAESHSGGMVADFRHLVSNREMIKIKTN